MGTRPESQRSFTRALRLALATMLVASVAAVLNVALSTPPSVDAHSSGAYANEDDLVDAGAWMTGLPNELQLSWLSVPGTHDSGAYPSVLTALAQTQSKSISEQLEGGIRAFDIRVEHKSDGTFDVVHGEQDIPGVALQDDVLLPINTFLTDNPGEVIFFHIQRQRGNGAEADFWTDFLAEAAVGTPTTFAARLHPSPSESMMLGKARGQIVVLDIENNLTDIPTASSIFTAAATLQNEYEICNTIGVTDKWIDIRDHHAATQTGSSDEIYMNFLSGNVKAGCSLNPSPSFVASGHTTASDNSPRLSTGHVTNCDDHSQDLVDADEYTDCPSFFPHTSCALGLCTVSYEGMNVMFDLLVRNHNPSRTGLVWMDYPGSLLIQTIIDVNRRAGLQFLPPPAQQLCNDLSVQNEQDLDTPPPAGQESTSHCHDGDDIDYGDNCLGVPNPNQSDIDGDGIGDWEWIPTFCDTDVDGDGLDNFEDPCPTVARRNWQTGDPEPVEGVPPWDPDEDGIFNECEASDAAKSVYDADADEDRIPDETDNCKSLPNPFQFDFDGDGHGDVCDKDIDGDGVNNRLIVVSDDPNQEVGPRRVLFPEFGDGFDNCPYVPNADQENSDDSSYVAGSGQRDFGDACDLNDDNDSVFDYDVARTPRVQDDNCRTVFNNDQKDRDDDLIGDACDDTDGDTVVDLVDNCWLTPNTDQADSDRDGVGDVCDLFTKIIIVPDPVVGGVHLGVDEGQRVDLSIDQPSHLVTYEWDTDGDGIFDDGSGVSTFFVAQDDPGSGYGVRATRTSDGLVDERVSWIVINNVEPHVTLIGAHQAFVGVPFDLTVMFSDPGPIDRHTVEVTWAVGAPTETIEVPSGDRAIMLTTTYATAGTQDVEACVDDGDGGRVCEQVTVQVLQPDPVLTVMPPASVPEGITGAVEATLEQRGATGPFSATLVIGGVASPATTVVDGTPFTLPYTFDDEGSFAAEVCIDDVSTTADPDLCEPVTLLVSNVAPGLSISATTPIDEASATTLSGTIADPGADSITGTIDWGDGTAVTNLSIGLARSFDRNHTYADNGSYTIQVCVNDGDEPISTCRTTTVVVDNVAPIVALDDIAPIDEGGTASAAGTFADVGTADTHTATIDWGDGSGAVPLTLGDGTFSAQHTYVDNGTYPVEVCVTDDDDGETCATKDAGVANVAPEVSTSPIDPIDENTAATLSGTFADVGTADTHTATIDWGDGSGAVPLTLGDGTFSAQHTYVDNGTYPVEVCVTDDDDGETCRTRSATVNNVAPVVTSSHENIGAQYSDVVQTVTVNASDVPADAADLAVSTSWGPLGDPLVVGLPPGLTLDGSCGPDSSCTHTISGVAGVPAGSYVIEVTVNDDVTASSVQIALTVTAEDARADMVSTDLAVEVEVDGDDDDADAVTVLVEVREVEPDVAAVAAAAGDIGKAVLSAQATPVGPGSPVTGTCTPTGVTGSGYDAVLTVSCTFPDVPVNVYSVGLTIGGGYYTGSGEDMFVVFDPDLGFTTGGGWFYWPGTADATTGYPGDRTNFGYTAKYKRNGSDAQGNLLMIRHLPDGTRYRVKSNALDALALGETAEYRWASFIGKATYLEPGWPHAVGNHAFTVYVEDRGEPGRDDRFWIQVRDKQRKVIDAGSLAAPAAAEAVTLERGNIQVHHK